MKPPLSADEQARLKALQRYEILDTPSEQDYDDITLLAAQICGTPIAVISLIDENRQWFKSKYNLEINETPRDTAFCAWAIALQPKEPMIIRDAREDERFAANPMVKGSPNIRFYAGAPLVTSDNFSIGMLSVFDHEPRELTDGQLEALQALARQVMMKLELRRMSRLLAWANENLRNLSLTDDLTGLYNRRGFLFHAEQQLKLFRSRRSEGGLWLLAADMDKLKYINDTFGHAEGSFAIAKFADILRQTFRRSDVIARFGGDEFTVLFINALGEVGEKVAERLERKIAEYNAKKEKPYQISASYGLTQISPDDAVSIETAMNKADKLLYEHKRFRQSAR